MSIDSIKLESSWKNVLKDQFSKEYFLKLSEFIKSEYKSKIIYPAPKNIFRALDNCAFNDVKVVILGQDPYHGIGQANGLCFAVNEGVALPPSLKNIFKEIKNDLNIDPIINGDLTRWSKQGVLLLNATLTVVADSPGSHQDRGWETFTDAVVETLSKNREGLVFILWGNYAKNKGKIIDRQKHLVLESAHPSPFSAYNGFFGCAHFSQANKYLKQRGLEEIDWR
jgi:uracil-DNA glycosylase